MDYTIDTELQAHTSAFPKDFCYANLAKINLQNDYMQIRVLEESDSNLLKVHFDPKALEWFVNQYESCEEFVQEKLDRAAKEESITFVIINKSDDTIIGSTSLYDLQFKHKSLEMGATWLGSSYKGRGFNPMAKLLLLGCLFEQFELNRVQWKTYSLNIASQNALRHMGIHREGTLRDHLIIRRKDQAPRIRSSLVFGLIQAEWPLVKPNIISEIDRKFKTA